MTNDKITVSSELLRQAVDWFQCHKDNSMSRNNAEQLADEVSTALREALEQPALEPVAAQHRFRHPQKTEPDWSPWQQCDVRNRPPYEIDMQGWEVEYRPLYTAPQAQQDARAAAIQECIDRLVRGGKPAEAQMLRHHFGVAND